MAINEANQEETKCVVVWDYSDSMLRGRSEGPNATSVLGWNKRKVPSGVQKYSGDYSVKQYIMQ
jgi:hypothetical protein